MQPSFSQGVLCCSSHEPINSHEPAAHKTLRPHSLSPYMVYADVSLTNKAAWYHARNRPRSKKLKYELNDALVTKVVDLCERAGNAILEIYQRPDFDINLKDDESPVTAADLAAHEVLATGLSDLLEGVPVLSEEAEVPTWEERQGWNTYWIIDPLDGTKEFINRNGEFTVNVALVVHHEAVLGVVHVPTMNISYAGLKGSGAWKISEAGKQEIKTRALEKHSPFVLVASRRHGAKEVDVLIERLEDRFNEIQLSSMGSSLKLCLVAEGAADLYPRLAPTCEWDTAAAQAVVEAAGGQVYKPDLSQLRYNTKDVLLNPWFYVVGDVSFAWETVLQGN